MSSISRPLAEKKDLHGNLHGSYFYSKFSVAVDTPFIITL